MKKLIKKIQSLLSKQGCSTYKEIYNFNYEIEVDTDFINKKIPPALIGDEVERNEIIEEMLSVCESKIITSRQCVLHKSYQDDPTLAACLSTMQAICRDGKIDIHVFVRSQNFDKNFCYDNQTYMMVMCALLTCWPEYKFGKIHVHVTSLHRFQKEFETTVMRGTTPITFC